MLGVVIVTDVKLFEVDGPGRNLCFFECCFLDLETRSVALQFDDI